MVRMNDFYSKDLAYIHHSGFGEFATKAGKAILPILRKNGVHSGNLLDLGCGSGIWAEMASRAGFKAHGIDFSPEMIRIARAVAPSARFSVGSLWGFPSLVDSPQNVITVMGEGLNYLPDTDAAKSPLNEFLEDASKALHSGGILAFDILVAEGGPSSYRTYAEGKDWAVLVEVSEPRRKKYLRRKIVTFRQTGKRFRRGEETHQIKLFPEKSVLQGLRKAGFNCLHAGASYGSFGLAERRMGFIAKKMS